MTRTTSLSLEAAELDRDLAAHGYGVALLKSEVATVLRTSKRTVDRLISSGRLKGWKSSRLGSSRVLVPRKSVAALLAEMA